MKFIKTPNSPVLKGIISKKQAETAIEAMKSILPPHKALQLSLPDAPGHTTHLDEGVDLTKVRNPDGGPIKFRYVLVGMKDAINRFADSIKWAKA